MKIFQLLTSFKGNCLIVNLTFLFCVNCSCTAQKGILQLKVLNFAGKGLDSIPAFVFKAKGLEELYLGPSEMTVYSTNASYDKKNSIKVLPIEMCSLSNLRTLDLTYNDLRSLNNLECLEKLQVLNLAFNDAIILRDNISTILKLPKLKVLIIVGTDFLPDDIDEISKRKPNLNIIFRISEYTNFLLMHSKK